MTKSSKVLFSDVDAILNALPDPLVVVNQIDEIVFVNMAGEQFLQGSRRSLSKLNLQDLIPHDSPLLSLINRARRSNSSMTEYGVRISTPRIGSHMMSIDAAPMAEHPGHMVLAFQEQSIAGKIDDNLTHHGAARSVTALAAMLAHEVKNPLSGIRGAAQLLETMIEPADRELTKLITDETDRIVDLLNRMEIFSENPQLERKPNNIHEILDHVIKIAKAGFGKQVNFKKHYDPSLPAVYGNRDQFVQIFLNLVKNACETVDRNDGEIIISTAYRHGVRLAMPGSESRLHLPLMVSVQDNGSGIPDDLRPHLFDPFITTKQGGSGLGLALVAKFVGDHGGVIDVISQPRDTRFNILLPMMRNDQESMDG